MSDNRSNMGSQGLPHPDSPYAGPSYSNVYMGQQTYATDIYAGPQRSASNYAPPCFANADMGPSYSVNPNANSQDSLYSTNANVRPQPGYSVNANMGSQSLPHSANANVGPQGLPYFPNANLGPQGLPYSADVGPQGPLYPTGFVAAAPSFHPYNSPSHIDPTVIDFEYTGPSPYAGHLVSTFNNDFSRPFWEPPTTVGQTMPASFPVATAVPVQHSAGSTSGESSVGNPPMPLSIEGLHFCQCCEFLPPSSFP